MSIKRTVYRVGWPDGEEELLRIQPDRTVHLIKVHERDSANGQKYTFFELAPPHPMNVDHWVKNWDSVPKARWTKAVNQLLKTAKKSLK